MNKRLIHPGMVVCLGDFFPKLATIQSAEITESTDGQEEYEWDDIEVDVPCSLTANQNQETRTTDQSYVLATHTVALAGYYPTIDEKMRVSIDSTIFNIISVRIDSRSQITYLDCELMR